MNSPASYQGVAFNEVPNSKNEIHGDAVAAQFGFKGGLVPGVTVSAYLAHPAVTAWGLDYVARGAAQLIVEKPVYDGQPFAVEVTLDGDYAYDAVLTDQSGSRQTGSRQPGKRQTGSRQPGSVRARGRCWLPSTLPVPPQRRGDAILPSDFKPPPGTPETMRGLQRNGLGAMRVRWSETAELTTYFRDSGLMPPPVSASGGRHAHLGFVLGLTNWALDSNVAINPWLHLQTESQCHLAITPGTELIVESAIVDLFEKKGHYFCDVQVNAFRSDDDAAVMHCRLRAIYQLRSA